MDTPEGQFAADLARMFREVAETPSFIPDPAEERRTRVSLYTLKLLQAVGKLPPTPERTVER